ncbi:TPA: acyltransferase, partial [Pseudomonas aeruginosa]|nr:acyltransferase [Pseudomonas aeruginosa]
LPYEWLFYFCLPFLGVLLGNRPSPVAMAIMAGMIWLVLKAWQPNWTLAYMFVAGGLSALAVRSTHLQRFAASIPGNLLCLALLLLPGVLFPSAYQETAILILGLAFLLIAAGSSLFGLLTQALSRFLGEMTYSMYLLHGCILFISFELLIGRDNAKAFSALEHWLVIGAITPLVVLASYLSFRFIESPAMQRSRQLSALLGKPMLALKRLGRHPTAG